MLLDSQRKLPWIFTFMLAFVSTLPAAGFDQQEFDRRRAEHKRKMEEFNRNFDKQKESYSSAHSSSNRGSSSSTTSGGQKTTSTFDPRRAPDPKQCFLKFIQVVKGATSFEQLLPYYSSSMRGSIESSQKRYSPADEAGKKKLYGKDYFRWQGSPYESSLRHMKEIVANTKSIQSVGSKGNRAGVRVNCKNGNQGNYSFVGEDNYWKYDAYKTELMRLH